MSSILLSFVGNQDPTSDKNHEEGSIVTLVRHLCDCDDKISYVILLHTQSNEQAANDTKVWLLEFINNPKLASDSIELLLVNEQLSQDPIDFLLTTKETRKALEIAKPYLQKGDRLELNASSGTPAMKSAWSILQAAGYAPNSRVWQVRNPRTMSPEQNRIFETNVDSLKQEFDRKIVQQQAEKHDYNGALITFENSSLIDNGVGTLLKYGSSRLAAAFDASFNQIKSYKSIVGDRLYRQSKNLKAKHHQEIIKEIYFQAEIKNSNREYSELLVKIFVFQESVLFYLLKKELLNPQDINSIKNDKLKNKLNSAIENNKELKLHLNNYRLHGDRKLILDGNYNRIIMTAILEYFYDSKSEMFELLQELNRYCDRRNEYIHQLQGIDNLEEADQIITNLKNILKLLDFEIKPNPFELLNEQINRLLAN